MDAPEHSVWATVEAQPVVEHRILQVPHRHLQPARDATLARRFGPVTRCPPQHRPSAGLPTVPLGAVQVRAVEPPPDIPPIAWLLLSTVEVHTTADAIERVAWDACRWGIAVWQRMVTSGCRLAARQLGTGERLQRCLTRDRVMAWRVFSATMLARAVPEMPCSVLLEIAEWQALSCAIQHYPTHPHSPPSLGEAVRWLAQLGGFVGRRHRDQPGTQTVWRGVQHYVTSPACIV